jgi:hypothetical protein
MKRAFLAVGLISLALLLVGCGPANPEPVADTSAGEQEASSAEDVQRISVIEARLLADADQAVLYDTRSAASFLSQRVAGAVSFPEAEVIARFGELDTDKAIIFY